MLSSLPLLFLLLPAVIPVDGYSLGQCPPQGGAYALCGTTVVYIVDTSTDLDPSSIETEFDWIRNNIIPGTAWGTSQSLALISYGTGNVASYLVTPLRTKACAQLDAIQRGFESLGSDNVTLYSTIQSVNQFYGSTVDNMVLFTASKDLADINLTAGFIRNSMKNEQITVIALAGANFTGFPARVIYSVDNLAQAPPNLPSCIIKNVCDQGATCNIYGATDPPVYFPTTVASTSQAPTTVKQTTTTTRQPTTTTKQQTTRSTASPPTNNGPQCQCNTSTVWIDVMFLLDGSSAGGQQGLEEIWSLVGTSLDFFTVQKTGYTGSNYTTRVGIITYGAGVTVYRSLGNVTNDDLDDIDPSDLPYYAGDTTNLEGAMQAAMDQFATSNHRANAKEVIVVVATTFNPTGVTAPQKVATQFKESGGILVIYNYVPEHGAVSDITLEEIATPGYFLINIAPQNDTYLDLNQALCDANCFCGLNYESYTNSYRQTPTNGCYQPVSLTANNRLAGIKCADFNGYLTSDQSQDKSAFLSNLIHGNVFWLGLTYTNQWRWADNSSLGAYQPWATGVAPNGGCAYVGDQLKWYGTDCRNGYNYICEAFPCDALHYCP